MSYQYAVERPKIFTDEGQRDFLKIMDAAKELLAIAGAFRQQECLSKAGVGGDSWFLIACVDRMVELGFIAEVPRPNSCTQYKVYVKGRE